MKERYYMTLEEYDHMYKVYQYVYSAPPNSSERERRLEEISSADNEKLWDFYSGLCSGRIKRPEPNKESEVNGMNKEKKIASYEDFKKALTRTGSYKMLCEFKRSNPELYKHYIEKLEAERR